MHLFWIKLSCNSNIELEAGKTFLPEIAFLQEAIISLDFAVFRLNFSLVKSKAFIWLLDLPSNLYRALFWGGSDIFNMVLILERENWGEQGTLASNHFLDLFWPINGRVSMEKLSMISVWEIGKISAVCDFTSGSAVINSGSCQPGRHNLKPKLRLCLFETTQSLFCILNTNYIQVGEKKN